MDDTKAFQLSRSSWKENVFSTFKADSGVVEVTFTFSKGGGVESAPFMEIKNYDKYDYEVFVNAKKIFIYGDDDGSATTTKNFTVKAKGDCKAELLPGASVSSITEVNAQKKEKKQ